MEAHLPCKQETLGSSPSDSTTRHLCSLYRLVTMQVSCELSNEPRPKHLLYTTNNTSNMNTADLFNLGNLFLLIASFPLLKTLIQDRNQLRGYNPIGTVLTFLGLIAMNTAFFLSGIYLSNLLGATTLAFWGIASYYSISGWISHKENVK